MRCAKGNVIGAASSAKKLALSVLATVAERMILGIQLAPPEVHDELRVFSVYVAL